MHFHVILESACQFQKKKVHAGIFIGIILNLQINLERIDSLTILILLNHEHGISFYLFWSLISLNNALYFLVYRFCISVNKFASEYFIDGIIYKCSLKFFSTCSLLVIEKQLIFTYWPSTSLNSPSSFHSCFCRFLGFSVYMIILLTTKDSFILSSPICICFLFCA